MLQLCDIWRYHIFEPTRMLRRVGCKWLPTFRREVMSCSSRSSSPRRKKALNTRDLRPLPWCRGDRRSSGILSNIMWQFFSYVSAHIVCPETSLKLPLYAAYYPRIAQISSLVMTEAEDQTTTILRKTGNHSPAYMFLQPRRLEVSRGTQRYPLVFDNQSSQHVTGQPLKVPLGITGFFLLPCNPVVCYTHGTAKESEWRNTASCAMIDSRPAGYDTRQNDNPGDDDSKLFLCVNIHQ